MTDVFISYSKSNAALVRQLSDAVKRLGYSVWWDDELPPHLSYSDVIADKIGSAKAAIVVWSENAAASQWVRAEADVARSQKKLIQTSIDGRMPPMPFNQIQCAAIGDWRGEDDHPGWMKVKASLDALVGPREAAAAAAPLAPLPPQPVDAAPPAGHGAPLATLLIGLLILAGAILFYLLWARGGAVPAAGEGLVPAAKQSVAAPPAPPAVAPEETDALFSETATIAGESAEVRSGPSAQAFVVGRLSRGDSFATYRQDGDWWQVRLANGALGYLPRIQIRLAEPAARR